MGKRICLNKSVLDFMESVLTPKSRVIEFGGGWSSKWLADRCGRLLIIETSHKWAQVIMKELGGKGHIIVPRTGLLYLKDLQAQLRGVSGVDLVLIDGVEQLRNITAKFAWPLLKQGGWLLFDDAQREKHNAAVDWLIEFGGMPQSLIWQPGDVESAHNRLTLAWQK